MVAGVDLSLNRATIMDSIGHRALTSQLSEDLGWLEEHSRQRGSAHADHALRAGELHLAAALVRNCIGPYLDGQSASPLHLAVIGGAGAGKSTVANLLSGAQAAETNPQAGFTRHPIAKTSRATAGCSARASISAASRVGSPLAARYERPSE